LLKPTNFCVDKLDNLCCVHAGIIVHDCMVTILEKVPSCCAPPWRGSFPQVYLMWTGRVRAVNFNAAESAAIKTVLTPGSTFKRSPQ
jgi:hypothetical protein